MARILVTGADGFIGSHLVEHLLSQGHEVRALCMYNSFNSLGWLSEVSEKKNLEIVLGDVRDREICDKITRKIDNVMHLAALIAIPYSFEAPSSYFETNVRGTQNICQSSLLNEVKSVLVMSTSEVYGTAQFTPMDENHPLQAQSPYSASKIGADSVATSYHHSYGLPLVLARPFNTFGPRQSERAVIPTVINQILKGHQKISVGLVTPIRDLTYVSDTVEALAAISQSSIKDASVFNIGSGSGISIENLIAKIQEQLGTNLDVEVDPKRLRPGKSEVHELVCNPIKLEKLIGFKQKVNLEDGLARTIEWNRQRNKTNLSDSQTDYVI
jgi:NAD dependent epimerase/dehydratase